MYLQIFTECKCYSVPSLVEKKTKKGTLFTCMAMISIMTSGQFKTKMYLQ